MVSLSALVHMKLLGQGTLRQKVTLKTTLKNRRYGRRMSPCIVVQLKKEEREREGECVREKNDLVKQIKVAFLYDKDAWLSFRHDDALILLEFSAISFVRIKHKFKIY